MNNQGERGEKGDQGQHGQSGDTGETGRRGAVGETGGIGKTGATGKSFLNFKLLQLIAFLFVAVVMALAVHLNSQATFDALHKNQVVGCKRANVNRIELAGFLRDAAAARRSEGDFEIAKTYAVRAKRVEAIIEPNCEKNPQ